MITNGKLKLIEYISRFSPLNHEEIELLNEKLEEVFYPKGTRLSSYNELHENAYFILKGACRSIHQKDEKEITFWFAFEDELLISMRSSETSKKTPEIIEFIEDTHAVKMTVKPSEQRSFKRLNYANFYMKLIHHYIYLLEDRLLNIQGKTAREKYDWLTIRHPELSRRVPLGYIASFLGITQETLSRIRSGK